MVKRVISMLLNLQLRSHKTDIYLRVDCMCVCVCVCVYVLVYAVADLGFSEGGIWYSIVREARAKIFATTPTFG